VRTIVPTLNGYRWTAFDILIAISVVAVLGYFAVSELAKLGISLASVAGVIWGFGTLLFICLYPLPIFGGSVEGENLKKENRPLTQEELRKVTGLRHFTNISPRTVKLFVSFFMISGGLTLLGILTNT
jgi:hypothetical protein